MYKSIIIVLVTAFFFIDCSGDKIPVIKLGKNFNKTTLEVSQETDKFTRDDNFSYSLSQKNPFDASVITRRFYKGKVYIDMIRIDSVDIKINPDTKKIGDSIPLREMMYKFGGGNYMILFIIDDSVIAKKAFTVEGPEINIPKTVDPNMIDSERLFRKDNNAPAPMPTENEIPKFPENEPTMPKMPSRNMPVSPGEMMRDQR